MTRGGQPDPARSLCPFLVLTPGISAQFLEADPEMSRANTGRFAGVFGMTCEREQLLAMQKVEGSNPFSRSQKGLHLPGLFCVAGQQAIPRDQHLGTSPSLQRMRSTAPRRCSGPTRTQACSRDDQLLGRLRAPPELSDGLDSL